MKLFLFERKNVFPLLAVCVLNILASAPATAQRSLAATYGCDEVVATLDATQAQAVLVSLSQNILGDSAPLFIGAFQPAIQYGVEVKTVCASCESVKEDHKFMYGLPNDEYKKYCGEDVYGYADEHSGLVMTPLTDDGAGNLVPLDGTLTGWVRSRSSRINVLDVPSQSWTEKYDQQDMLPTFLATVTKGAVSILPDYMGYGLSSSFSSFASRVTYGTSFLPLWVKTGADLRQATNCKTALADAAFFDGYSEGGYIAVNVADAINKALDVDVVQVLSGGAPFRSTTSLSYIYQGYKQATSLNFLFISVLLGITYSSANPDVLNYNTGQNLLADAFMDPANPTNNMMVWQKEENITYTEIYIRLATIAAYNGVGVNDVIDLIWNPNITSLFQSAIGQGLDDPCSPSNNAYVVGLNDKFCEAVKDNDIIDVLHNADYPIIIYQSVDDEVASYANIPDVSKNPYLNVVNKTGDHLFAGGTFFVDATFFLLNPAFIGYVPPETKHNVNGCPNPCIDSSLSFQMWGGMKDCDWVKRNPGKKCFAKNQGKADIACRKTCGTCAVVCADTIAKFQLKNRNTSTGTKIVRCAWVKKNTTNRCKIKGVKAMCPATCGEC